MKSLLPVLRRFQYPRACHQRRRASGGHEAWKQQRQQPALAPSLASLCHIAALIAASSIVGFKDVSAVPLPDGVKHAKLLFYQMIAISATQAHITNSILIFLRNGIMSPIDTIIENESWMKDECRFNFLS